MDRDYRGLLIILGVLLFVVLVGPLFMGWMMGAGMMGPGMMWGFGPPVSPPGNPPSGWSWGLGMGLGWLMMLAFWGVVIIGIALLVRWLSSTAGTAGGFLVDSVEVLRRRYAAGEISQGDYERIRQALER